ncbi:MAG: Maleate isomerase [Alphaproteobacteria bacterium MarineAlpha2_Bin1]|nr:MAG: Maleate isomerase [Alphaproteobacteria bacterium MarineAlpha2_Bin1]
MVDSLGFRMKFGVIAPSTNTSVQPEFDKMAPHGVTNHMARIHIPDMPVNNDEDFDKLIEVIAEAQDEAVERLKTMQMDHLIMGMSAETFWDGLDGATQLQAHMESISGVGVTMGSDACQSALKVLSEQYGTIKKIACITPYMPIGDKNVRRFFTDLGFDVKTVLGLKCKSPVLIAHTSEDELKNAINEVNSDDVDAIVQAGTNLAMARVAAVAEEWLNKPIIAINTATYWHALRNNGLDDKVHGFGSLLSLH